MYRNNPSLARQLESIGILFLFFAYWFFLRAFESVDASQSLALQFWLPFPTILPALDIFTPLVTFVLELLSWRVLRHFIPVMIALWLSRRAMIGLVQLLLGLPDEAMATNFMTRLQQAGALHTPPTAGAPAAAAPGKPSRSTGRAVAEAMILSGVTVFLLAMFLLLQVAVAPMLPIAIPVSDLFGIGGVLIWFTLWLVATTFFYLAFNQPTKGLDGGGIQIRRTQFEEDKRNNPWLRVGGPGRFKVDHNDVIVTERNGRFWRVAGPGTYWLVPFETIRTVLDLRQQERDNPLVRLMTKEGIELRTQVSVTYRLARGDNLPADAWPLPFDHDAVRRAAYQDRVLPNGGVGNWEGVTLGRAVTILRQQVAQNELDELIYPEVSFPARRGSDPHRELRQIVVREGKAALLAQGIDLLDVRLGALEPARPIQEHRVDYWKASWERQQRLDAAATEAEVLTRREFSRAEGEAAMIEAIMESIQQARLTGNQYTPRQIMALRMVESLERLVEGSSHATETPLLKQLNILRDQLNIYDDMDPNENVQEGNNQPQR